MLGRRRRARAELPVLPPGSARETALRNARANGRLPAQARTRTLVRSGLEAWVGLMAADQLQRRDVYQLHNSAGTLLDVEVTIRIRPTPGVPRP